MPLKRFIFACLVALPILLQARFRENPDPNTLWIEDGIDIETGAAGWGAGLDFEGRSNGFVMKATGDAKRVFTQRPVPVSPEYGYLVFEIASVLNREGYRGLFFNTSLIGAPSFGPVSSIPKGLFIMPFQANAAGKKGLRIDLHGAELAFSFIKMEKTPAYRITLESPAFASKGKVEVGDAVAFYVHLAEEAEDVTLAFFDSYTMPQLTINGRTRFQAKPEKGNPKIWGVTIPFQTCAGDRLKAGESFKPGRLFISATLLGGAIKGPLFTCNAVEFAIKP